MADSVWIDGLKWSYRDLGDSVELIGDMNGGMRYPVVSGTSIPSAIKVPEMIGEKPVSSLGNSAFSNFDTVVEVTLPSTVTNISDYAFYNCQNLKSVNMPNALVSIGENAFANSSITNVAFAEGLVSIGQHAFTQADIVELKIPSSVRTIGDGAFENCDLLETVTIDEGVTNIGYAAFAMCYELRRANIPSTATNLGAAVFGTCPKLSEVSMPDTLTEIPGAMFEHCSAYSDIHLPTGLTKIGWCAYSGCMQEGDSYSRKLLIPDGVTTVEFGAFSDCGGFESVELPESLEEISDSMFARCNQIYSLSLPTHPIPIAENAFENTWVSLCVIPWDMTDAVLTNMVPKYIGPQYLAFYDATEEIPDYRFSGLEMVERISFPKGVKRIGKHAFDGCHNMLKEDLPDTLETIDDFAFDGCSNFAYDSKCGCGVLYFDNRIDIPASVTYIGEDAFGLFYDDGYFPNGITTTSIECFTFGGKPPRVHVRAFTNMVCGSVTKWKPAVGYYRSEFATEWKAVIRDGMYGGLTMKCEDDVVRVRLEFLPSCADSRYNLGWLYHIEDGKAVIGTRNEIGTLRSPYGYCYEVYAKEVDLPEMLGGCPLVRIEGGAIRWYTNVDIERVVIPATVEEVSADGKTIVLLSGNKPQRLRFRGLPPKNLAASGLLQFALAIEYPLSLQSEWQAFLDGLDESVNAAAYDDQAGLASIEGVVPVPYVGCYDGLYHSITVKITNDIDGATITYATQEDGEYTASRPMFRDVCSCEPVYYRVSAPGYREVSGFEYVTIYENLGNVTVKTPVPVPYEWLKACFKLGPNDNYEWIAQQYTGKVDPYLGPLRVWQEYVMGTDPSDPFSRFTVRVALDERGKPDIAWSPDKRNEHHVYTVYGAAVLAAGRTDWVTVDDPQNPPEGLRFFWASVALDQAAMSLLKAQRPKCYFAGDVDGDGRLSEHDVVMLKRYLAYMATEGLEERFRPKYDLSASAIDAADVDGDGSVDQYDLSSLMDLLRQ